MIKPPDMYVIDGEAVLEWAVMQDPFGNDFCIIRWPLDQAREPPISAVLGATIGRRGVSVTTASSRYRPWPAPSSLRTQHQ